MSTIIFICIAVIGIIGLVAGLISRYKRCPSDKVLVVYGKVGGSGDNNISVHLGGGAFVWPVIQESKYLSLSPININFTLKDALSNQNIRVQLDCSFTVGISTDKTIIVSAAQRLLSQTPSQIKDLAHEIIVGQLRAVVAKMSIEQLNSDRDVLIRQLSEDVESELQKVGIHLINANISDIRDNDNYIESLGKKSAAKAINEANVLVSEERRKGEIGVAQNETERSTKTAELKAERETNVANSQSSENIGIERAQVELRKNKAILEADAIETENLNKIRSQISNGNRLSEEIRVSGEVETNRAKVGGEIEIAKQRAKIEPERIRREVETMRLENEQTVLIENNQKNLTIEATEEAKRITLTAEAQAKAIRTVGTAEAEVDRLKLEALADGLAKIADTNGGINGAVSYLLAQNAEKLSTINADALKNLKIDKITVWDNGKGEQTTNFIDGFMKAIPGYKDLYKNIAGIDLPFFNEIEEDDDTKVIDAPTTSEEEQN